MVCSGDMCLGVGLGAGGGVGACVDVETRMPGGDADARHVLTV